ncbi:hypothetical protein [Saccharothrix sp. ST-888]|uniref:hypothetical protein n=1 Tax=Saccharothrix sp. ST-888 TaxID=1427391 RepID=UPI0005EC9645|nr:hypothetical protein [Saccharothrix sp. ST-888]KJK56121.1 hypothetical protein UK12_24590 [Saccharothrix sp. ST-888]
MHVKIEFSPADHAFNPLAKPVEGIHEIELTASIRQLLDVIAAKLPAGTEREEFRDTYGRMAHAFSVGARQKLTQQDSVGAQLHPTFEHPPLTMTVSRMEPLAEA